uniref:Uncharacterized protein n=1 Tax=Myripristis murdjan TaxID=586833 RepID=A0A667YU58_9TELE
KQKTSWEGEVASLKQQLEQRSKVPRPLNKMHPRLRPLNKRSPKLRPLNKRSQRPRPLNKMHPRPRPLNKRSQRLRPPNKMHPRLRPLNKRSPRLRPLNKRMLKQRPQKPDEVLGSFLCYRCIPHSCCDPLQQMPKEIMVDGTVCLINLVTNAD